MNKDMFLGLLTIAAGVLVLTIMIPLGVDMEEVEANTPILVRPDFWPRVVGVLMTLVGVIYTILSWRKFKLDQGSSDTPKPSILSNTTSRRLFAVIGVAILFIIPNETTGLFLPAVAIFTISAYGFGGGQWPKKIAIGIAVPIILVIFFEKVAGIPIPLGILQGLME